MNNGKKPNSLIRGIKKFFYSAFVTITFIAYALESRGAPASSPTANGSSVSPTNGATTTAANPPTSSAANPDAASLVEPAVTPAAPATSAAATKTATVTTTSGYKDGTYTGSEVDVRYGYVKIQTTIQGGQITNVQFLEYPSDRRTSARINSTANPRLVQEAIQAQSAKVNIITGATLTSQGFQQSLQAALNQAKG